MPKVSSITRVLEIIEAVSYASKPISPLELSQELDIPKPTIHRLIQNLVDEGFVTIDIGGGIIPGKRVRNLGVELWQQRLFFNERQMILQKLVDELKETCGIGVPYHMNMIYTNRAQTTLPIQIYLPVGAKSPMWCTATGKLYLSQLPSASREKILQNLSLDKFTKNTITDIEKLNAELDRIAETGIGIDNEEFISEMVAIAVPIRDRKSRYLASLYLHAPTIRVSLDDLLTYVPRLQKAAQDIQSLVYELPS
ncbi:MULTISPECIES: IclR family transcriptional regulator [Psychrobacter]|uniref:HTH-type transcriptional repressor AllR n=1 Tax=Psychrobacter cryohalolentis (strain ATCC BAA-1226 / DSM 17306 / VKM B-2378 / K5) TaxID=335284 RepID=Q1QAL2_PSYCK|nr:MULTISPECIES: IclR family transcriptional regulator [Psychrobacter]ABE75291.1 transcriptional regulator, IclR family [Psychrobacter cryohalolentis K5]ASE25484.1 IclR family transcriptional regulator [Psychrobacter cryohalolentis]WAI87618.1 Transcriptional regulator KdgR [Psychrobacter sp. SC65A.3]